MSLLVGVVWLWGQSRRPTTLVSLGKFALGESRLDEAIAAFCEAIKRCPDYAEAYPELGIALNRQGKVIEAVAAIREALRFNPEDAIARAALGDALSRMSISDDDAEVELKEVIAERSA